MTQVIALAIALVFSFISNSYAQQGKLEYPRSSDIVAGIGLIYGWICDAERVYIKSNDIEYDIAYGTERADTISVCGDSNNGFMTIANWNLIGHRSGKSKNEETIAIYADGVLIDEATFTVVTSGEEYLRNIEGGGAITLSNGRVAVVEWSQRLQNFTIIDFINPEEDNRESDTQAKYVTRSGLKNV